MSTEPFVHIAAHGFITLCVNGYLQTQMEMLLLTDVEFSDLQWPYVTIHL